MPNLSRFGYLSAAVFALLIVAMIVFAPRTATEFALQVDRLMAGFEEDRVRIDGFDVPYFHTGEGPTLVLLHGFTANRDHFSRIARYLKDDFRLIIPDLPGFGQASAPADADYGLDAQARRILAFIDTVAPDTAVHLGGSSMGGYIAAVAALQAPDRVASLWLLAPGGLVGEERSEVRDIYERTGRIALLPEDMDDFERVLDLAFHNRPYMPGFVRHALAGEAVARREQHARIFTQVYAAEPLNAHVGRLEMPLLLVWGSEDRVLHPSGAKVMEQALPHAEIVRMPEVGHLPMLEAPRATADDLLAFHRRQFHRD